MSTSRKPWKGALLAAVVAAGVTAPLLASPAQAIPRPPKPPRTTTQATLEVIASGLKNPRDVTALRDGTILVAESGEGLPGCEAGKTCAGLTGSIYQVKGAQQGRIVTGLPSSAVGPATPGASVSANGPSRVVPAGDGNYVVVTGLGGDNTSRAALGPNGAKLGTLFQTKDGKVLADLTDHETRLNPDGGEIHANPWSFVQSGDDWLVTDAGANTIVRASGGTTTTEFVLPKNQLPTGDVEGVPTGIVRSWDGTVYVADMSGTKPGAARIWKIAPGQKPQVLVTGLTNLIDLDLDCHGNLLALSFTKGFQQGPPLPGSLSKINLATKQITEIDTGDQLKAPTGLDIGPGGEIYVTNNSTSTNGQLVRVHP